MRLDREVAIKVLPERLAHDAGALARFEREAKAVAALSHPNILAIQRKALGDGGTRRDHLLPTASASRAFGRLRATA
jgi:serine/threonine protein kinase